MYRNRLDSTEVYSFRANAWTEAGKLPARMRELRAATVSNSNRVKLAVPFSVLLNVGKN